MSALLFLDPATGERLSYDELFSGLRGLRVDYLAECRPESPGAALRALLRALLLDQPLTLFDRDFTADEIVALGFSPSRLNQPVTVPGRDRADELVDSFAAAARDGGFRLTLFTSGSTGKPKRVTHTLAGLTRALRQGPRHHESIWGLAYNPTHIAGVQVVLQAFFNRNPLIHLFHASPDQAMGWIREHGVTHLSATPSFYRLLLSAAPGPSSVRSVAVGGERAEPALLVGLGHLFPGARLRNLYASTEAGTLLESDGEWFSIPPGLADRVRVRDGQLEVHASLLGSFDGREVVTGWYCTGDLVEPDSTDPARFRIRNRQGDLINVGGHKVNPAEVEELLLACPGVREARVYGRSNSVLGQILCAEVVAGPDFEESAARAWLEARVQPAKVPRLIKRLPALPRTRTGKLARN